MKPGILDYSSSTSSPSVAIIPFPSSPQTSASSSPSHPSQSHHHRSRGARVFRSIFRALPICKFPAKARFEHQRSGSVLNGGARNLCCSRITGTLFGYREGPMSLSIQENSMCLPTLVVELALPTHLLTKQMSEGTVRIALECEKKAEERIRPRKLLEEESWTVYLNGKKSGQGQTREAGEDDLGVMEALRAVSMGAGVLPGKSDTQGPDAEMAYMRATFYHVVGSRDCETLYMFEPQGNSGPDLTIFFIRL